MKNSIGNPVTGEDFFDREQEQKQIWRKLERDHLLMLAPRRIGKTSLMHRLCETAMDHGFQASLASFAPCKDELDCIRELIKAIGKNEHKAKLFFKQLNKSLKKIKGVKISILGVGGGIDFDDKEQPDWRQVGEALAETLAKLETTWLLCVDELPVFVLKLLSTENGLERTHAFLYWFRDLRQNYHQKVRWILAGSIGMDTVASRLGLGDTINDLAPFPLGAFTEQTADHFLACLAQSYELPLSQEIRQYMIQCIGWPVPYYLQLFFGNIYDRYDADNPPDTATVDSVFEELLSPTYRSHFDYWRQRLKEELGSPDDGHARQILNAACYDRKGVRYSTLEQILHDRIQAPEEREETLRYLLDVLENDGYLVTNDGYYRFRLEWLRRYWQRRVA